ncbi:DUF342 domain-containing protein [Caloramator sp. E03]|uniref:flagellar assembly protein A n=1 Tax=Caloramator sp. E03 TaxID=2576307 RepID=UPI001110F0F0|nr:FapA family protein [Caloramator sp. E03]QCX32387.1 DUF342 domain-containing protein [Caloramator sp. E03]
MKYLGKTLEEALENAKKDTNRNVDEMIYEIIEQKNSLFKKQVAIELKGFKEKGQIGIKEGKIVYYPKELLPSIIPGEGVKVIVNNKVITNKTNVKETDEIIIEVENKEAKRNIEIDVSKDNMQAFLKILYQPKVVYKLKDKEPSSELLIEAEKFIEEFPEKYTKEDVENIILQKKIKYGIQWENIAKVLDEGGEVLIAKGTTPIEPVDDTIKYFFMTEDIITPVEKNGKVDYYNIGEIECVEEGQLLAVRQEGKDGKVGYDVYGNIILPRKRKIQKIIKGSGCEVLDNGNRAISQTKGMPTLKNERISVNPVHIVNGDVNLKTGNIEFKGNIVIKGSVREGMKIRAGKEVMIMDDVEDAQIFAGGNIKIGKSVISSTIKAGEKQLNDSLAIEYLNDFSEFIEKIKKIWHELEESGKFNSNIKIVHAIKILLESQFKPEKEKILKHNKFIVENFFEDNFCDVWNRCINLYYLIERESISNCNILNQFNEFLRNFINSYKFEDNLANVTLYYCQNSEIYATNDVEIKGKGCYNTNIFAGNSVVYNGYSGVYRGGQVYAKNFIKLAEVGSQAGIITVLKTSFDGIIEAQVVYQNTILYFGESSYRIEYPCKQLKAYVKNGEITIEKFKL